MEKLKHIKCDLEDLVYQEIEANEITHLKHLNTHELGEVIDMIKDLSEAIYYCSMIKEAGTGLHTQTSTKS